MPLAEENSSNSPVLAMLRDAANRQMAEEERVGDINAQGEAAKWGALGSIAPNMLKQYQEGQKGADIHRYAEENSQLNQQGLAKGALAQKEAEEQYAYKHQTAPGAQDNNQTAMWKAQQAADLAKLQNAPKADAANLAASQANTALATTQNQAAKAGLQRDAATFEIAGRDAKIKRAVSGKVDKDGNPVGNSDPYADIMDVLQPDIAAGKMSPNDAEGYAQQAVIAEGQRQAQWMQTNAAGKQLSKPYNDMASTLDKNKQSVAALGTAYNSLDQYTSSNYLPFYDTDNAAAARDNIANVVKDQLGQPDLAQDIKGHDIRDKSTNIKKTLNTAYDRVKSNFKTQLAAVPNEFKNDPEIQAQLESMRQVGIKAGDQMANDPDGYRAMMMGQQGTSLGAQPKPAFATNPPPAGPQGGAPAMGAVGAGQPTPQAPAGPAMPNPATDPDYYKKLARPPGAP